MTGRPYVETLVFLGGISADIRAWVRDHPNENVPISWGSEGRLEAGGRAATAAIGAVRLGRRFVDLVGSVGDDLLGDSIVASIKESGVSVRLVDRIEGASTGIRQVVLDRHAERRMVGVPNANWQVGDHQIRKADSTIFGADLLFATLEIPIESVTKVVRTAASRNVPVLLNATPMPTASGEDSLRRSLLDNVDVLLTNWTEAQQLADLPATVGPIGVDVAKSLLRMGPKAVVITMGEHGSLVAVKGRHAMVQSYSVRAVDTTSAGDSYAAALAVGLTSEARGNYRWEHLVSAARFASAASAVCVSRRGSMDALPTREDVERLMASQPAPVGGSSFDYA